MGKVTTQEQIDEIIKLKKERVTHREIAKRVLGSVSKASTVYDVLKREFYDKEDIDKVMEKPKILVLDIETAPIKGLVWGLWQNNLSLTQIDSDWFILSFAAYWLTNEEDLLNKRDEDKVIYDDLRGEVIKENDNKLLSQLWKLLDEADIIITQNGKKFDEKKINARFILNGYSKPSPYKHIDTLQIAKKQFGFTSNKLAYMTEKLCTVYKKLEHGNFFGFHLWEQVLKENPLAWDEMEEYNRYDVLSLAELYYVMRSWDSYAPNIALYNDEETSQCNVCSSTNLKQNGYAYTNLSKFQKYLCGDCGAHVRGRVNLNSKEKMKTLNMNVR